MNPLSLLHRSPGGHVLAVAVVALTTLTCLLGWPARSAEPVDMPRKARLRVLYSGTLFSDVNESDALAALRVWIEALGRSRGFSLETKADLFDRQEEADKRIQENSADLVVFDPVQYLQRPYTEKLDPEFIAISQHGSDAAPDDYVVVTRRDRNWSGLEDLRHKSVKFYKAGADWGRIWMDVILDEEGLGSAADFFGSSSEFSKPSSVVLPVFFGKCDAGVVKRWSLNTMAEMNPQLARQLRIMTNSPSLPEGVVCVHKDFKVFREDLMQGLAELHTEPKGQQLMLLFKIDRLERFHPESLAVARELLARHARARRSPESVGAAAVTGGRPES